MKRQKNKNSETNLSVIHKSSSISETNRNLAPRKKDVKFVSKIQIFLRLTELVALTVAGIITVAPPEITYYTRSTLSSHLRRQIRIGFDVPLDLEILLHFLPSMVRNTI